MSQAAVREEIKFNSPNPVVIIAASELGDMRFKAGGVMSLRAEKLNCLFVQKALAAIADDKQHAVPSAVIN